MKDRKTILLLVKELENDFSYMKESAALLSRAILRVEATLWSDELDLLVLGGCLHFLYNSFEGYFLRVAKFFENNVDQQAWHRDLLDRMTLEIPEVRPAVITEKDLAERVDELRRFRHLFRNLYKTRLNAQKLKIVHEAALGIVEAFLPMHEEFCAWLASVAEDI
ncbi:MAG: hypothetical protein ABSF43_01810 [Rectinemataceae bacterium]|jgi:hypothetical protein